MRECLELVSPVTMAMKKVEGFPRVLQTRPHLKLPVQEVKFV